MYVFFLTTKYSYVFYLETRVEYLESLLQSNGIQYSPAENFVLSRLGRDNKVAGVINGSSNPGITPLVTQVAKRGSHEESGSEAQDKLNRLVSQASKVAVQGTSDSRYLGSSSGISFARVVFAAVKS